jgi:diacylglycerol kinase family enzyme
VARVVVLANPSARWLAVRGPVRDAVFRPRAGVEVAETTTRGELDRIASELAARAAPPEVVVLAGGDGSHGAGVDAIARAFAKRGTGMPAFALAPAGTTCTVARNWSWRGGGIVTAGPRAAARACAHVLDAVTAGPFVTVDRPTLRVASGLAPERLAFIVGAGLVARFFELYEERGADGYRTAARIAARLFASAVSGSALAARVLAPVPCELIVDGRLAPFAQTSLFVASAVRDLGLSLRLTYRAGEDPSRFHVVASPLDPRALGRQLPRVLAARPLSGPRIDALASRVSLVFHTAPGGGAFVVDGDLVRGDDLVVLAGPVVRVLALERPRTAR